MYHFCIIFIYCFATGTYILIDINVQLLFFIENNPPYVIGILPKFIEVRTIETKLLIQQIELSNAKYICQER